MRMLTEYMKMSHVGKSSTTQPNLLTDLHQTNQHLGEIHNGFTSNNCTLHCIFVSILLFIVYPSQAASDDPTTKFINNLFGGSGVGSKYDNP
jgi:hypothetical protein